MSSLAAAGLAAAAALVGPASAPAGAGTSIPVPTFSVGPTTYLVDGQVVDVSWSNQFVGVSETTFYVFECLPGPVDSQTCVVGSQAPAAASGASSIDIRRFIGGTECGTDSNLCSVLLIANSGVIKGSVPISFFSAPK